MGDPNQPRRMPVISSRPAYDWINRVNRKKAELDSLDLSAGQQESLRKSARHDFAVCTLRLEGVAVTDEQINRLPKLTDDQIEGLSPVDRSAFAIFSALALVETAADSKGPGSGLTPALLTEIDLIINQGPGSADGPTHPASLAAACYWWTADSFLELHPIEQAALAHLRLMDLKPFPNLNERISLLASSLFAIRASLPPLTIATEAQPRYKAALEEGRRMNTQPMVEIVAEMTERAIERIIHAAKPGR
jgi:Fic family protein